ncbi:MAG: hypothetical protein Q4D06_07730 [Coriobacteriia bacterium]|nr:hypothetical protein [Coriobacteriia bacterium]
MKYITYGNAVATKASNAQAQIAGAAQGCSTWDLTLAALQQSALVEVIPEKVPKSEEYTG